MLEFKMHPHEKVLLTTRKHPLILIGQLIPFAVLDYLPYLLPRVGSALQNLGPNVTVPYEQFLSFGNPWFDFIVGIYWLFIWMGAFSVFTDYFLDQWVITNERIIDINQKSFWSREVASVFLNRVQNVETEIGGIFHTLFGFGTVVVESAGAEANLVRMNGLPRARHVRDLILEQIAKLHEDDLHPDKKSGI